jgi:hypothetical protein
METNVPGIYAIGDIAGRYMFAHTAARDWRSRRCDHDPIRVGYDRQNGNARPVGAIHHPDQVRSILMPPDQIDVSKGIELPSAHHFKTDIRLRENVNLTQEIGPRQKSNGILAGRLVAPEDVDLAEHLQDSPDHLRDCVSIPHVRLDDQCFASVLLQPSRNLLEDGYLAKAREEELLRQLRAFHEAGFGGILPHARVGLSRRVGYLTDEYFRLLRRVVEEQPGVTVPVSVDTIANSYNQLSA